MNSVRFGWYVFWARGNERGKIVSTQDWEYMDYAQANLDARLNCPVPDISLPSGAYIVESGVEVR